MSLLTLSPVLLVIILVAIVTLAIALVALLSRQADDNGIVLECDQPRNYRRIR